MKSDLSGKTIFLKGLDGQSISMGPQRYIFTEYLLTGDAKATFNQAALNIGILTVDYFIEVLLEMTKWSSNLTIFKQF